jgi:hypothetical protein
MVEAPAAGVAEFLCGFVVFDGEGAPLVDEGEGLPLPVRRGAPLAVVFVSLWRSLMSAVYFFS